MPRGALFGVTPPACPEARLLAGVVAAAPFLTAELRRGVTGSGEEDSRGFCGDMVLGEPPACC